MISAFGNKIAFLFKFFLHFQRIVNETYWVNFRHGSNGVFCDVLPCEPTLSRALDTVDWFTFNPFIGKLTTGMSFKVTTSLSVTSLISLYLVCADSFEEQTFLANKKCISFSLLHFFNSSPTSWNVLVLIPVFVAVF